MSLQDLISALPRFRCSERANTTIMFGLAAVPLMMSAGFAVDYGRLTSAESELQAATDSAALTAATAYATGNSEYVAVANEQFTRSLSNAIGLEDIEITTNVSIDQATNTLTMTAEGALPTTFLRVAGYDQMALSTSKDVEGADAGVSSSVALPVFSDHDKGEIVLVMDYSSSMNEYVGSARKYVTMRAEASNLVNDLSQGGDNPDVKFGLVPFSHAVRVTMPRNFFYGQNTSGTMTSCVDDRNYPYNTQATTPDTSTRNNPSKFYTTSCSYFSSNGLSVRPLSTGHSGTMTQISSMQPYGNTHIALGMETAWHLLTPNAPYTEATNYNDETLKAVVLLTDGQQTSPGYGPNNTWSVAQAEANLATLCTSMKQAGIRVVTVSFDLSDEDNATTETRLRDCASDIAGKPGEKYYYDTDTNQELATAFGVIRDSLARNMYLSK